MADNGKEESERASNTKRRVSNDDEWTETEWNTEESGMTTICKTGQVRENSAASLIKITKQHRKLFLSIWNTRGCVHGWIERNECNDEDYDDYDDDDADEEEQRMRRKTQTRCSRIAQHSFEWLAIGATKRKTQKKKHTNDEITSNMRTIYRRKLSIKCSLWQSRVEFHERNKKKKISNNREEAAEKRNKNKVSNANYAKIKHQAFQSKIYGNVYVRACARSSKPDSILQLCHNLM